jgi:plastocyanin
VVAGARACANVLRRATVPVPSFGHIGVNRAGFLEGGAHDSALILYLEQPKREASRTLAGRARSGWEGWMRKISVITATIALGAITGAGTSAAQQPANAGTRITTVGKNQVIRNALIQSTLRFYPERLTVNSGTTITIADRDRPREPHTLSIVRRKARPGSVEEVFNCKPCRVAGAHVEGQRPKVYVNQGKPGLNRSGDSVWLAPGKSVTARVTARAGKTLYYICAIHGWMQGQIRVG